jgi:spermidine synthase
MVIDGCIMLTGRDNFIYHEMMTHPALFTHPRPRRVVIIGGGDCGTLCEVLRHPEVESVVQVEIDERVTRLAEQYFPELCTANADPRARLLFGDGIAWMAAAPASSIDVVIVDSTDPVGPAEGLFGAPFYCDCLRALGPGGILVQQTESPLFHLESILLPTQAAMRTAGFGATQTLFFPQCSYPSGWWTASLAYRGEAPPGFRERAARERPFPTRYYNPAVHRAALAAPEFVAAALRQAS